MPKVKYNTDSERPPGLGQVIWTQTECSLIVTEVDRLTKAMLPYNGASEPIVYMAAQRNVLPPERWRTSASFYNKHFLATIDIFEKQAREYADILLRGKGAASAQVAAATLAAVREAPKPTPAPAPAVPQTAATEIALQLSKMQELVSRLEDKIDALLPAVGRMVRREIADMLGGDAEKEAEGAAEPLPDVSPAYRRADVVGLDSFQVERVRNSLGPLADVFQLRFVTPAAATNTVRKFAPDVLVAKKVTNNDIRIKARNSGSLVHVINPTPEDVIMILRRIHHHANMDAIAAHSHDRQEAA